MVNKPSPVDTHDLHRVSQLIAVYVAVVAATLVALGVLAITAPAQATSEAWGHIVIVGIFAVLLPLRLRSARHGSTSARTAIGVIAAVLMVVNLVEGLIPGLFPVWMRIEMLAIAALMAAITLLVLKGRR